MATGARDAPPRDGDLASLVHPRELDQHIVLRLVQARATIWMRRNIRISKREKGYSPIATLDAGLRGGMGVGVFHGAYFAAAEETAAETALTNMTTAGLGCLRGSRKHRLSRIAR